LASKVLTKEGTEFAKFILQPNPGVYRPHCNLNGRQAGLQAIGGDLKES
jgi:hypothetical protein